MYSEEERKKNAEEPEWLKSEKEQFAKYRDKNGDGFLDKVRLQIYMFVYTQSASSLWRNTQTGYYNCCLNTFTPK